MQYRDFQLKTGLSKGPTKGVELTGMRGNSGKRRSIKSRLLSSWGSSCEAVDWSAGMLSSPSDDILTAYKLSHNIVGGDLLQRTFTSNQKELISQSFYQLCRLTHKLLAAIAIPWETRRS